MDKIIRADDAVRHIKDGMTIMVGGFMGCGNPHTLMDRLAASGVGNLTVICNDAAFPKSPRGEHPYGVAKLIRNKQVKKLIATHVGLNPEVSEQMNDGTLEVVLIPQGSFVEMIRAGGAGLGGVLTPTGLGTVVQDAAHAHSVVDIDGVSYLLERPLRADVALISGYRVDPRGNVWYKGTTRNFNQVMATAADLVIAEADHLVDLGSIEPENVMTSGILVDYVVEGDDVEWTSQ